ncbi:hypothetical protein T492DRAFT_858646 [Pavlovales sp. CCMP2436]|nr:hypothetical protein T492DRAFT_858646 [Pavlovales sp. CCMP2436]
MVELVDLAGSPHLNGAKGKILNYDPESSRYHVQLPDGRLASLSPANVILGPETRCTVAGLESAAAQRHNGTRAKVVGYDRETGRYEVMVAEDSHLILKRENVRV